jgi:hypothetical protein
MRYASLIKQYLALKNEIFSSTDRAFYKNAQIFTAVRFALTLLLGLFRGTVRAFEINQSKRSARDHRPRRSRPKNLKTGRDPKKKCRSRPVIGRDPENFSEKLPGYTA